MPTYTYRTPAAKDRTYLAVKITINTRVGQAYIDDNSDYPFWESIPSARNRAADLLSKGYYLEKSCPVFF